MLFSTVFIAALALFSHSASALSLKENSALFKRDDSTAKPSPSSIVQPVVDHLEFKVNNTRDHLNSNDSYILIKEDINVVILALKEMVSNLSTCNCLTGKNVNLQTFREEIVMVFVQLEVFIKVIIGQNNKDFELLLAGFEVDFQLHIGNVLDLSVQVDVGAVAAIREHVTQKAFFFVGVNILALIDERAPPQVGTQPVSKDNSNNKRID